MHIKRLWAALCAALFLLGAVPMTVGAASSYLEAGDKTYFKTRQAQRGGTGEGYVSSLGTRVNLMWFDQSPTNSYIDKYDLTPQYDGKVWAYCIHHGLSYGHPFRRTENLTDSAYWNSLGRGAQQGMKLTTIYGFPARTPAELGVPTIDDAVAATQAVLWEYQQGYRTNAVTLGNDAEYRAFIKGTPAEPAYHKILEGIRNHTTAAGFADSTLVLKPQSDGRYAVTVTDTKGTLAGFSVTASDSRVTAKINGNTLTLSSTEAIDGNITLTFQRILPPLSAHGVFVAVGRNAGEQEIMTGVAEDPFFFRATARVEARGAMQIRKVSEDGKVDGIRFLVSGNGLNDTFVTANGGRLEIPNLLAGEYTVTEQVDGAYEPQKSQTVTVVPGQTTTVTFSNILKRGNLRVVKTSEDSWLEGHTFRLSGTSLSGDRVELYAKTDSQGVAAFKDVLISGDTPYVLEEIDTDERYVVPSAQNIAVEWNKVTEKTVVNRLKKWNLTVSKVDAETGTAQGEGSLAGAQYGLYRHGLLQKVYTTDASGRFTTDWYPCGAGWSLQEIAPSLGYQLDTKEYQLGVEPGQYTMEYNGEALTVRESVIQGRVAILKHNDDGSTQIETPEVGAEFEVFFKAAGSYEQAKESERDRLVTDENGYAVSKWLPAGVYTVKQTKGREGTERLPAFDVYISEQGKVYRYLINNASFESQLEVVKKDAETGKIIPLSGFGFKIRDIETGKYITQHITYPEPMELDTFCTASTGRLMLPEPLKAGRYELVEVQAAPGYVLDGMPVPFTIDGKQQVVTVEKSNKPQKGVITVGKTGEVFWSVEEAAGVYQPVYREQSLAGAVFDVIADEDVYTPDGTLRAAKDAVVDILVTSESGARSKKLYPGVYRLEERQAPEGTVLDSAPVLVQVKAGEDIAVTEIPVSLHNQRQRIQIDLKKLLEPDERFQVAGDIGKVSFGLYAAEDLEAADGSVILKDGLLEVVSCKEDGTAMFQTDLPFGSFYLKELSTDEHYQLSDRAYPIEFTYAGQETAVVHLVANEGQPIENSLIRGSVLGHKVDENGQAVPGAVMGLFRPEEKEFTEDAALLISVSNEYGEFRFDDIPFGDWLVREIRQPEGFLLSETLYPVTIAEQGQMVEINVENIHIPPAPVNPLTGEDRHRRNLVMGLAAVAVGGVVALFIIRKKKG